MKLKHLALVMAGVFVLSSCGGGSGDTKSGLPADALPTVVTNDNPTATAANIEYNDIAVHDPSVIKGDDGYFYVFGSHLASAKSKDLMKWESVTNGIDDAHPIDSNPLFNTYSSQVADGIDWTGGYKGSWAPDIIKLKDGKYHFYYDFCTNPTSGTCDAPRSYIGVATSSNITGPFVNDGLFLRTGMTRAEIDAGKAPSGYDTTKDFDGATMPNGIDPHVYYDKSGKLWMVYGSYFGGIFILEMDETTGMAKPNQGYGTHVAGGGFAAIEGSWITYSPETDYYYMFNSIAGFAANDGYNIRVSRSKNPNGPFLDSAGNNMLLAKNNTETLSKYGVKLIGGFNFVSETGDEGASVGYLSPGHNSVYYDAAAKKYFLVTHTRFPNRGEEHSVRVHELWLNADGWFVASPQRYAPISGTNVVDTADLAGDYRFISHQHDSNTTGHNSIYITLNADRTISGEVSGYYLLSTADKNRITIVITADAINGSNGSYEGVMQWQWDDSIKKLVPTFSALSLTGTSVWGSRLSTRTVAQALTDISDDLSIASELRVTSLTVPTRGTRAAVITWASSNLSVINFTVNKKTGKQTGAVVIHRPSITAGDQTVTLTATIVVNGQPLVKTITTKVIALSFTAPTAQFSFEDNLVDSKGHFAAGTPTGDRITNTGTVAYAAGWDGKAVSLNGTNGVRLPDGLISSYKYTVSFWIKPNVLTSFSTGFFGATDDVTWLSFLPKSWNDGTMLWGRVPQWFDGISGVAIPQNEWSNMVFSVDQGTATIYINGEQKFTGTNFGDLFTGKTGLFALGVNYWDTPFNGLIDDLKIYNTALSPDEIKVLDPGAKTADEILTLAKAALDLGYLSALKDDIDLGIAGPYTTAVSWTTSNTAAISNIGIITQPSATSPDATATLTATISYGGKSVTKDFAVTVKSKAPPAATATYSFDENLDETSGVFTSGVVKLGFMNVDGGQVSYADGVKGKALALDGTSCVKLADNLITGNSYSISIWLNEAVAKNYTSAFFGMTNDTHWVSLVPGMLSGGSQSLFWSGSATWFDGLLGATLPLNTWTHIVVTVNAGAYKAYINGVQTSSLTGFPDVLSGATQFAVGCSLWDTPFQGQIDELKIYNEVLSADDTAVIYSQGVNK